MRLALPLAVFFLATPAVAYVSDEGHNYSAICTKHGVVLTSDATVTRQIGHGVGTDYWTGREKLFLGKQCDAMNQIFGKGTWGWANGGFFVTFEGKEITFGRQELYCPGGEEPPSGLDCNL